jgi:hypothetical protein
VGLESKDELIQPTGNSQCSVVQLLAHGLVASLFVVLEAAAHGCG